MQRTRNWRRRVEPGERRQLAHDYLSRLQRMERPAVRALEGDKLVHLIAKKHWDDHPFLRLTKCGCFVYLVERDTRHNAWKAEPSTKPATCLDCLTWEERVP